MMTKKPPQLSGKKFPTFVRPLIPVSLFVILGIGIGVHLSGYFYPVLIIALISFIWVGRMILSRSPCILPPLLLLLALGYLSVQPWTRPDMPSRHVVHFTDHRKWKVEGVVLNPPIISRSRGRFIMRAQSLSRDQQAMNVFGNIAVSTRGPLPNLVAGDRITLTGYLRPIRSFRNPGGFDYARFMAFKQVRTRIYSPAKNVQRLSRKSTDLWWTLLGVRRHLSKLMDKALRNHDTDSRAILKALTFGERHDIDPDLKTAFTRSGVAHVLAISGLHIGIVAAAACSIGFWLSAWIPCLVKHGWVRKTAAALALLPVLGYGLLSGFSPSTQRAVVMVLVFFLSIWVGGRHNWFNSLACAALIILIVFPPSLFNVSFQLSFTAVAAIVLGGGIGRPHDRTSRTSHWQKIFDYGVSLFQVSILAAVGTLPLVLFYFDQLALFGPLTNLIVVPIVGLFVVPAGILGMFVAPVCIPLAHVCWHISVWCLELVIWVVEKIAAWPGSAVTTIIPNWWEALLFYLLLILLRTWKNYPPKLRITVLSIILIIGSGDALYWLHQRYRGTTMTVTALDVGQGTANLVCLPGGFTALIDGGGFSDNKAFDIGRYVISPLLRRRKILTIDLMVLSHPNSDHLNGMLYLLDHFNIREIWSNHEPADTVGYRLWRKAITRKNIPHTVFKNLKRAQQIKDVCLEILAPPKDFLDRKRIESWRDLNNNSLVIRIQFNRISFLFPGDIMFEAEADLIARHSAEKLRSTFLIIPHHGSRHSSSPEFLSVVQPSQTIISAGWHNRFGFPHDQVLENLMNSQCRVWRTDLNGAIEIDSNGIDYRIKCYRSAHP